MVHEGNTGPLGDLVGPVGTAAFGIALAAILILGLALGAELLRRRHRALRLIRLLDTALPGGARTAAVSLLAVAASFAGTQPAGAADSVRGWLGRPPTSTSQAAPVATPQAIDDLVESVPPPTFRGPVVLIPPAVEERPAPAPIEAAPRPLPAPAPPPVTPPAPVPAPVPVPVPAVALPTYVVQPGDCLWAIAARILGPRADGRTIDAGWRRIYDVNRDAVGNNPSLIHIGLVLQLPPLDAQP